jgi:amino acid permease
MIQRIQTLFLFLVFATSLAAFFFPIANFLSSPVYTIELGVFGIKEFADYDMTWPNTILLPVVLGLTGLIAFITIFLYKRRKAQVRLIRFDLLLNIIYLALIFFYYVPELETLTQTNADYISEPGIYLPIVSVVFLILASRFIKKDEKLIRSADRLR